MIKYRQPMTFSITEDNLLALCATCDHIGKWQRVSQEKNALLLWTWEWIWHQGSNPDQQRASFPISWPGQGILLKEALNAKISSIQKYLDNCYRARATEEAPFHIFFGAICSFWKYWEKITLQFPQQEEPWPYFGWTRLEILTISVPQKLVGGNIYVQFIWTPY